MIFVPGHVHNGLHGERCGSGRDGKTFSPAYGCARGLLRCANFPSHL